MGSQYWTGEIGHSKGKSEMPGMRQHWHFPQASSVSTGKHILCRHMKTIESSGWDQKWLHRGWKTPNKVILGLIFVFRKSFALILFGISIAILSLKRSHKAFIFPFSLPCEDRYLKSPFAGEELNLWCEITRWIEQRLTGNCLLSLTPTFAFTFSAENEENCPWWF